MPRVRLPSTPSDIISSSTKPCAGDALLVATGRVLSGTFSPGDAHHLFDELLRQGIPVPERPLHSFLAALARAPASDACSDGPALAIDLFRRMNRGAGPQVFLPTPYTYNIFMDYCCRARRLDLTLAASSGQASVPVSSPSAASLGASVTQSGQKRLWTCCTTGCPS
jgi:hypothetical protein